MKPPAFLTKYSNLITKSRILERIIPRQINTPAEFEAHNRFVLKNKKEYEQADLEAVNQGLLVPIYDLMDRGGKRWRPVMGMIYAECHGRNISQAIEENSNEHDDVMYACGLTEIVHNGSLMVDDLEDQSLKRRGQPCTYLKYGPDYAVNTGTFMYYAPILKIDEFIQDDRVKLKMHQIYSEEMTNIHFGQNWDIHWHNGKKMPTEEQYLQMVINKTSVLPRKCIRLISAIMDIDPIEAARMINYTETLGAAFQIQDDLIAVVSEDYARERGIIGEDIHEGKRTLMVSKAYWDTSGKITDGEKERLVEILDMKTTDDELLREAIGILRRSGSISYAEQQAKAMLGQAWKELAPTLPASEGKDMLEELSMFLIDREL